MESIESEIKRRLGIRRQDEADEPSFCGYSVSSEEVPEGWGGWCCTRPVWDDDDSRCIWHSERPAKPFEEIRAALADERETPSKFAHLSITRRLDGAVLASVKTPDEDDEDRHWIQQKLSFQRCTMFNSVFKHADISRASFSNVNLAGSNFKMCIAPWVTFSSCELEDVTFESANLTGARFHHAPLNRSSFVSARLEDTNFYSADLTNTNLRYAKLFSTYLSNAILDGANLEEAQLEDVDLRDASLKNVRLHDVLIRGVRINEDTEFGEVCIYEADADALAGGTTPPDSGRLRRVATAIQRFRNRLTGEHLDDDSLKKAIRVYRLNQRLLREAALPDDIRQFRIRERHTRRKLALQNGDYSGWLNLSLQRWSTEYGENPWRVVASSILVIAGCAVLYPLVGGVNESVVVGNGGVVSTWLGRLYFSVSTFTTLGFGDFRPATRGAQLLASVEAFLGGLLMALLVFVLGRRTTW